MRGEIAPARALRLAIVISEAIVYFCDLAGGGNAGADFPFKLG